MRIFFVVALFLLISCAQQQSQSSTAQSQEAVIVQIKSDSLDSQNQKTQTQSTEKTIYAVREFSVSAVKFEFVPATIEVNQGDTVRLKITSGDVRHGIAIQGYNIRKDLPVNQEVTIEFVADKKGEFPFYCSVFCGSGHGTMRGLLVVK